LLRLQSLQSSWLHSSLLQRLHRHCCGWCSHVCWCGQIPPCFRDERAAVNVVNTIKKESVVLSHTIRWAVFCHFGFGVDLEHLGRVCMCPIVPTIIPSELYHAGHWIIHPICVWAVVIGVFNHDAFGGLLHPFLIWCLIWM